MNQFVSAATDVPEFISDLDGGQFERKLSVALSQVAAAVIDQEGKSKGKVSIEFTLDQIPGTHQVRIDHALKFSKPTRDGKSSEEEKRHTVLHVGKYGALSLAQPQFVGKQGDILEQAKAPA
jgi:hypothetical protein